MVRRLAEKVGLEPLLCPDPQLCGALGAALFAQERLQGKSVEALKAQYGYADGTGEYYITIDMQKCDGCGRCVEVCPAQIFEVKGEGQKRTAMVKDELRRKLALLCPGFGICGKENAVNCHSVCHGSAITHSW
jgi:ferredoxin